MKTEKYTFSGHETFYCRHYWLKKGYDFLQNQNKFTASNAVTKLGVGKNMVASIKFWLKAFGVTSDGVVCSKLGNYLFDEKSGTDPYLEDRNSIWLLHYYLVKNNIASLYSMFFNKLKNGDKEFSMKKIERGIKFHIEGKISVPTSEKTLSNDVRVFKSNYLHPKNRSKASIEDDFSGLLQELGLFRELTKDSFIINSETRDDISIHLFLFTLLDTYKEGSISLDEIVRGYNSPGLIFCMNEKGVWNKIKEIANNYKQIVFTDDAGIREVQISGSLDKWTELTKYYEEA